VPLAILLGLLAVHYRNRLPDKIINVISLAAISLPEFFIGYLLILYFAVNFGIATFPATVFEGMGFVERHRREAAEAGLPVILSNSLIAKLVSEIV